MNNVKFAVWRMTSSRLKPVPLVRVVFQWDWLQPGSTRCFCGTGFSREKASMSNVNFAMWRMMSSRLKPVPLVRVVFLWDWLQPGSTRCSCGTGFSREVLT